MKHRIINFAYLKKFNMLMGGLHLLQGILMLIFAYTLIPNSPFAGFKPEITQNFLRFDFTLQTLVLDSRVLFQLPFAFLVACFLFISAIAHGIIVSPHFNKVYNADLEKGMNRFRWFEYALSSSIMIVLIATLFGITDIVSLILIFVLNASMNLFGYLMELLNQKTGKVNWLPFIFGSLAGLAPWAAILIYMFGAADLSLVPWFVWAIVITYFVAFNTFPVNMVLQYKKVGKWKDYLYGERVYIVLSLVAKSLLAWLVLFGAMQP
ncbi:MAG: heliorhodopsin HeR [Firmicutes bacterium]|nr:heliorhodopsin HeR [Bacillota bacterium]